MTPDLIFLMMTTDRQRLIAVHIAAVRVREASLRALGMALLIRGNGLATPFKRTWQAACEAEEIVFKRITATHIIPFRGQKGDG